MRRVSVIVDGDEKPFTAALGRAAAEAAAFRRILDGFDDRIDIDVRLSESGIRRARAGLDDIGRSSRDADTSINQLTGRLRALAEAAVVLGPGLIPVGGVGIAGIAGIANQLGVAAAAGGTAVIAFQGVGDAVTALNEAALEPTAENLAAAEEQLRRLSPAARDFAVGVGGMRDELIATRDSAAEGLFPGLTESLDDIEGNILPRLQGFLYEVGDATGSIVADGVDSLTSQRWAPFFEYMQDQARPTLTDLATSLGDFAHGMGELLVAFGPLNDDFGDWLLGVADGFDRWAAGLSETEDFASFVDYIRETGPQVADTFGAMGGALVDIVQAASPLGGPVLEALELVSDVISGIADSPIGPKIFTMAAAFIALNKALAITAGLAGRLGFAGVAGALAARPVTRGAAAPAPVAAGATTPVVAPGTTGRLAAASTAAGTFRRDLAAMSREYGNLGRVQSTVLSGMSQTTGAAQRTSAALRTHGATAAKAGAGVAAFALVTTEAGESLGVQNTAMLGLMGSMMGPWGAAIGTATGFVIDMTSANDDLAASTERLQSIMANPDATLGDYSGAMDAARQQREEMSDFYADGAWYKSISPTHLANTADVLFGGYDTSALGQAASEADDAERNFENLRLATTLLGSEMNLLSGNAGTASLEELDAVLVSAAPAMRELGLTAEDLARGAADGSITQMIDAIAGWQAQADSEAGRTETFADTVRRLGEDAISTADSSQQMAAALDALMSPTLNAEEATHAWRETLQGLNEQLNADAGFGGATEASRANAAATRDAAAATKDMLIARAENGASSGDIANKLNESREAIIQEGIAAGFSRRQMEQRTRALQLTPALVRTVFEAAGIGPAERKARDLAAAYTALPGKLQTEIRANGIPRTSGEINALQRKYNLTPKQVQTLVNLRDESAVRGIGNVQQLLRALNGQDARPGITVQNAAALGAIAAVQAGLNGLRSKSVTITTYLRTVRTGVSVGGAAGTANALGGFWPGARSYAGGGMDLAGQHRPEFAGPGPVRIWREPETGGESYIPHANDHRRPGAMAVLEQTAELFGAQVTRRALGGYDSPHRGAVHYRGPGSGGPVKVDMRGLRIEGAVRGDIGADGFLKGQLRGMVVDEIEGHADFAADRQRVSGGRSR